MYHASSLQNGKSPLAFKSLSTLPLKNVFFSVLVIPNSGTTAKKQWVFSKFTLLVKTIATK